jgi:hypothetical protein
MQPTAPLPPAAAAPVAPILRPPAELDQLLSPIALYPDPLIAIMLPASTRVADLSTAANFAVSGASEQQIDAQPWDESVKALAHYPDLAQWMAENMAWTEELGMAFQIQSADVMNSIQRLRAEARANGVLVDTPQEQVVMQNNLISIVPVQADAVYIPYYDPLIIRTRAPRGTVVMRFGQPLHAGPWLAYGFDWRNRNVWIDRNQRTARTNWRATVTAPPPQRQIWRPAAPVVVQQRAPARVAEPRREVPHPTLFSERRAAPAAPTGRVEPRKVEPRREEDRNRDGRDDRRDEDGRERR